jgi:hypothetical protein
MKKEFLLDLVKTKVLPLAKELARSAAHAAVTTSVTMKIQEFFANRRQAPQAPEEKPKA